MYLFYGIGTIIYGNAKRHELEGADRQASEARGWVPASYQVVKWFVVMFFPIIPLGTYRVMKTSVKFFSLEGAQYSMQQVEWDWKQIGVHYALAYGWIVILILVAIVREATS